MIASHVNFIIFANFLNEHFFFQLFNSWRACSLDLALYKMVCFIVYNDVKDISICLDIPFSSTLLSVIHVQSIERLFWVNFLIIIISYIFYSKGLIV